MTTREEDLISAYIELTPQKPWPAEARVRGRGVAVWALVGTLPAVEGDLDQVAAAYEVPREAVDAAMAYYRRHQCAIDARLEANNYDAPPAVLTPLT